MRIHRNTTHIGDINYLLQNLSYGTFGENFTTDGLLEEDVKIGDQFRVGVSQNSGYPAHGRPVTDWS